MCRTSQKLLILLLSAGLCLSAIAEQGMQIANWRVGCDESGSCQLDSGAQGMEVQFERVAAGTPLLMALTVEGYAGGGDLTLGVDLHPRLSLNPGMELQNESDGEAFRLVGQEAKYQLIKQMRVGTRLVISYRDDAGRRVDSALELRGFNEALAYLETLQGQTQIVARPEEPVVEAVEDLLEAPVQDLPQAAAKPASDHWASQLTSLMPAIMGCLEWMPGDDQVIDKAWVTGQRVTVRSRHRISGERVACVLPVDGSSIEMIDSLDIEAEYLPGEGDPVFTPSGHHRPEGECLEHEAVEDADGVVLGWLSFLSC
jgi:hypothetical protein